MPQVIAGMSVRRRSGPSRRDALRAFAAGSAALVAGCGRLQEYLVPYVDMPEMMVAGEAMRFATVLPLAGLGVGVVVESREGRPVKVFGNPRHPASLGGTDPALEAATLDLFDPTRARTALHRRQIASWEALEAALLPRLDGSGRGVAVLTAPVASPTMARQLAALRQRLPEALLFVHDPASGTAAAGLAAAFGRPAVALPRLDRADVVVSLDADPLGPGPDRVRLTAGFGGGRRAARRLSILAAASVPTLTSIAADTSWTLSPGAIADAAAALLSGGDGGPFVAAARAALGSATAGLVLFGPTLPAELHAAAARFNVSRAAPVDVVPSPTDWPELGAGTLADLLALLDAGHVETLIVIDANPVYTAGDGAWLAAALGRVPFTLVASTRAHETALAAEWHAPLNHPLEDWSDLRAADGTAAIGQPLIAPLFDTRSRHDVLAMLAGDRERDPRRIVLSTWGDPADDAFVTAVLAAGVVAGTAAAPLAPVPADPGAAGKSPLAPVPAETGADTAAPLTRPATPAATAPAANTVALVLRPGPVGYGEGAHNAWLQECPDPVSKEAWGNALWLAPADAATLGLAAGDEVRVETARGAALVPVLPLAGVASGTAALALGYGRRDAGPIGDGVGVDASPLRPDGAAVVAARLTPTGATRAVVLAQGPLAAQEGVALVVAAGASLPPVEAPAAFFPALTYDGAAWGMVIDTDACTGCTACVVACQAENNIPTVGADELSRGRDMHWLRIDRYANGDHDVFQPVPCMHCESAPCEPVCPVGASVHDSEGLNLQVYNRCVGTRFCQANCPYKVRKFNFRHYSDPEDEGGTSLLAALHNPDVSVRGRGVMEKCTFCVQRISRARRDADAEHREIAEGEVVTACQAACPSGAIAFGDLNEPASAVAQARKDGRHYALLGHLGTRPRTTYLARVVPDDDASQGGRGA